MLRNYTGIDDALITIAEISYMKLQYIVIVKRARDVQTSLEFPVLNVLDVDVETMFNTSRENSKVIRALKHHFAQPGVYCSPDRRIASRDFQGEDDELLWSRGSSYCVLGYFGTTLIERRTPGNQGKRYFNRGLNSKGRAGNQLLVQIVGRQLAVLRGQMPISFYQTPNMKSAPRPKVTGVYLMDKYMESISGLGLKKIAFINLVDTTGWQMELSRQFLADYLQLQKEREQDVKVFCIVLKGSESGLIGDGEFQDLNKIELKSAQQNFDPENQIGVIALGTESAYVHINYHATIHKGVDGWQFSFDVFKILTKALGDYTPRINCIDSLDRTNAVLGHYLQFMGVENLKSELVQGGNNVSLQYASSEAMKQDTILVGRRTTKGKLQDLCTFFRRLYFNNLVDGQAADGYRLVQGEHRDRIPWSFSFAWLCVFFIAAFAGGVVGFCFSDWSVLVKALSNVALFLVLLGVFVLLTQLLGTLLVVQGDF